MKIKALFTAITFLILGSLLLLIVIPTIENNPTLSPAVIELIKEFSSSLILAFLLLITIEIFTRDQLIEEIQETLKKGAEDIQKSEFAKTLSDLITPQIFHQIDEYVIRKPYLLRDMQINLEFQPTDKPEFLKLIDTTSFIVENLATVPIQDELPAFEDSELANEYPQYPLITHLDVGGQNIQKKPEKKIRKFNVMIVD